MRARLRPPPPPHPPAPLPQDSGQFDGRLPTAINGCPIYGALSRWQISDTGTIVSPEQRVIDTELPLGANRACGQFTTHSTPASLVKNNGDFFIGMGDGASFSGVDVGVYGTGARCDDPASHGGAYRSQDPARWNGKILRLDGATLAPEIWSSGHRNPFRLTAVEGRLFQSDTGWYTYEELNYIQQGHNYGWPCTEGSFPTNEYNTSGSYDALCAPFLDTFTPPTVSYQHDAEAVGLLVASMSAIAGDPANNQFLIGDFSLQKIWSVPYDMVVAAALAGTGLDMGVLASGPLPTLLAGPGITPCYIAVLPDGARAFVSVEGGEVRGLPVVPGELPPPSAAFVATASILSQTPSFAPGLTYVTVSAVTNLNGREGTFYAWTVLYLTDCSLDGNDCGWTYLFQNTIGGTLSFLAPYSPGAGTLEIQLTVNTFSGVAQGVAAVAAESLFIPTTGSTPCPCGGVRTNVALPPAPASYAPPAPPAPDATDAFDYRAALPLPLPLPPHALGGPAEQAPPLLGGAHGQPAWVPSDPPQAWAGGAPATLTFGLRMSDGTPIPAAGAYVFSYDVFILSGCLAGGRCGYTRVEPASAGGGLGGWVGEGANYLTVALPPLLLGGSSGATLLVEARVAGGGGEAARAPPLFLPAAGAGQPCTCAADPATGLRYASPVLLTALGAVPGVAFDVGVLSAVQALAPSASPTPTPTPSPSPTALALVAPPPLPGAPDGGSGGGSSGGGGGGGGGGGSSSSGSGLLGASTDSTGGLPNYAIYILIAVAGVGACVGVRLGVAKCRSRAAAPAPAAAQAAAAPAPAPSPAAAAPGRAPRSLSKLAGSDDPAATPPASTPSTSLSVPLTPTAK